MGFKIIPNSWYASEMHYLIFHALGNMLCHYPDCDSMLYRSSYKLFSFVDDRKVYIK